MKIPANGFTHAGKFHADDVFATALLQILRPDIKITRGFTVPDDFDGIVYDIGFGMFDHHQEPREYRANGTLLYLTISYFPDFSLHIPEYRNYPPASGSLR